MSLREDLEKMIDIFAKHEGDGKTVAVELDQLRKLVDGTDPYKLSPIIIAEKK